ncbi:phosphoglycerate kinase [Edaphobacter sp. 12200R-103]|jgi:phosphoglycerate kinase|uniref:phosphoglycerate kinase n=1 Tax=Edaphobacter sp. 12200R-103 TaxID=2703788 RepID=UPI00138CE61F|nr:phosphoglycerate kinase [Edaphobacter sp. 12200R-103]QHS50560.1 phosphoglycerate kinase [Edaphobacter sp. 12200R-103]
MSKLSIRDLDLTNKRVLIRVDFNVPLAADGPDSAPRITDDTRIRETIPTIEYALRRKARVILCSHLGRPKGKVVPSMSLRPVVDRLRELLDHVLGEDENVAFSPDCIGDIATEMVGNLEPGQPLLLENLRFHAEEEKNDPEFARQLASLCDVYINDAFGSAHRAHASTEGITHYVPVSAAGLLMEKELTYLSKAVSDPIKPFVAIIGGAKVSDKIDVIDSLLDRATSLIIGGGMAYTFLNAKGQTTGKSLVEADKIDVAKAALDKAAKKGVNLLLPIDHVLADKFAADAKTQIFSGGAPFPADWMGLDIGPASIDLFSKEIADAITIVWNGPMGVFEMPAFAKGTNAIAKAVAANRDATSIVGGGDSVAAVHKSGVSDKISHISTGGGASLEFLEGKVLPGVAALTDRQ